MSHGKVLWGVPLGLPNVRLWGKNKIATLFRVSLETCFSNNFLNRDLGNFLQLEMLLYGLLDMSLRCTVPVPIVVEINVSKPVNIIWSHII